VSSPPPSPEDGNRSSFRNVVLSRIPDDGKVQKPSNSVCYTPSSEPFTIYNLVVKHTVNGTHRKYLISEYFQREREARIDKGESWREKHDVNIVIT
jgi:hypothetical protein